MTQDPGRTSARYSDDYGIEIAVEEIAYHRNGTTGEPFYVVRFLDLPENDLKIGVVFDFPRDGDPGKKLPPWGNPAVAVLSVNMLPEISFGNNSWRGDVYASVLYEAIADWTKKERR